MTTAGGKARTGRHEWLIYATEINRYFPCHYWSPPPCVAPMLPLIWQTLRPCANVRVGLYWGKLLMLSSSAAKSRGRKREFLACTNNPILFVAFQTNVCGSLLSSIDVGKNYMSCKMTADHISTFKASTRKLFSSLFKSQLDFWRFWAGVFSNMYVCKLHWCFH